MYNSLPGHGELDMQQRLTSWGYDAALNACRQWLRRYRLQRYGVEGHASVYNLYHKDLRTWYYVDELTPLELSEKLYEVRGVLVPNEGNLVSWLKADAQKPEKLEFNEDILAHASGEYVLLQLQKGTPAQDVASWRIDTTASRSASIGPCEDWNASSGNTCMASSPLTPSSLASRGTYGRIGIDCCSTYALCYVLVWDLRKSSYR